MIKIKSQSIYRFLFFVFLFVIVSRGFFELFLEKKTAFLIQVAVILVFLGLNLSFFRIKLKSKYLLIQFVFFIIFVFAAFFSSMITRYLENGGAPFFYSGIMCFLAFIAIMLSSLNLNKFMQLDIGKSISFLILILFGVAIYEQFTKTLMPGAWYYNGTVRPASLTGSKQHYSIILSILSLFVFQYWLSLKKRVYLIAFIIGVIGVFLSLTRSGAMILVLAFIPFIFYKFCVKYQINIKVKVLIYLVFCLCVFVIFIVLFLDIEFFFERILSSIDTKSAGNGERMRAWIKGLDLIFNNNNLFLGQYTGVITNATRTVTNTKSFVVESGTLQLILNFGLLGFLSFYLILFSFVLRIRKNHVFLFAVLFSCLCSTIVYQSIETIPFIVLLSLLPLISININILASNN